jgi:hypothetical protein
MEQVNHSERAHALLSASGASRWLNCTPSARLEEEYAEKKVSVYAAEGTLAHELSELYLRHDFGMITPELFESEFEALSVNELFDEEMLNTVPIYVDYCKDQYKEAVTNNGALSEIIIEQKLDLTAYIPDSFGTADCIILSDDTLEVIDLKYGKGVQVYAEWNKQLMLYGLGALRQYDMFYDIQNVRLSIVQPRINNISSWVISVKELNEWAENELKPKAKLAFEGKGELNAGEWCRFCAVKNRCRKLYEQQMEIAKYEFAGPELLSDEEIVDIIKRAKSFSEWANAITEYASEKAITENKVWPGLKLVEGLSRRKWADADTTAEKLLERMPELTKDDIYDMSVKSITAIEKIVGKKQFAEKLSDLTVKPQGKLTLVPEDDKRPAIGLGQAIEDFK